MLKTGPPLHSLAYPPRPLSCPCTRQSLNPLSLWSISENERNEEVGICRGFVNLRRQNQQPQRKAYESIETKVNVFLYGAKMTPPPPFCSVLSRMRGQLCTR